MSDRDFMDLTGRVALVTGAGQGVGAETARCLAAQGARVVVNDYVADRAEAIVAEINADRGVATAAPGDVSDGDDVARMVATATATFGPINVLVNNAGNAGANPKGLTGKPFWEKDPSEWEPFLRVNLYGVLHTCRAVIPGMIEAGNGGRLITVISEAGRVGEVGLEAYSAAKAGAAGLTRALARGLGRYDITANTVSIAATRTPATAARMDDEDRAKKVLPKYIIRRFGEPSDIAAMITFLASPASGWITGQTYPVNGGFSVALSELAVPSRRTQAQRRQETELALLEAATRLFAENGIDRTSLADIGQEAGYSRGLVNHRFGSKEAFVERLASDSQAGFVEDVGILGPGRQIETLHAVIDTYFDRIDREAVASKAFFVMWGAAFPDGSPLRSIFMADDARFRDGIAAIVRAGQAKGRIAAAIEATSFAVALVGLLRGIGAQYVVDPTAVDLDACKTTASAFVHGALMVGSSAETPPVRPQERQASD